jgi:hypothetical protein
VNITDMRRTNRFLLTTDTMRKTQAFMRRAGRAHREGWVLWAGAMRDERNFVVTRPIFPKQEASAVHVIVERDEIERIDAELEATREVIGVQLHTHPKDAFHTTVDAENPIITKLGALSVVVPEYAKAALANLSHCAVYRYGEGGWSSRYRTEQIQGLFEVDTS